MIYKVGAPTNHKRKNFSKVANWRRNIAVPSVHFLLHHSQRSSGTVITSSTGKQSQGAMRHSCYSMKVCRVLIAILITSILLKFK